MGVGFLVWGFGKALPGGDTSLLPIFHPLFLNQALQGQKKSGIRVETALISQGGEAAAGSFHTQRGKQGFN